MNSCNIFRKRYVQESKNGEAGLFVLKALLVSFSHILSFPHLQIILLAIIFLFYFLFYSLCVNIKFVFLAFISVAISLLSTNKEAVCYFTLFTFPRNLLPSPLFHSVSLSHSFLDFLVQMSYI